MKKVRSRMYFEPMARGAKSKRVYLAALLAAAGLSQSRTAVAQSLSYFSDVTELQFPAPPCNDPANPNALGCYTNWLLLSDIDGDNDLDVLFANGGGYYVAGNAEPSSVYLNDGRGAFRDVTPTIFGGATSRLRQVSVGDIDSDGDLDIYQPGGYGLDYDKLWIQTAPGVFADRALFNLPGGMRSRAGASHLGDLDGDGDLDLAVADWGDAPRTSIGNTWIYLNDGDGVFYTQPASTVPAPVATTVGRTPIDLDFADVDGDFDLDILVNHRNGQSRIFLNDGTGHFTDGTDGKYPIKKGPYVYNQELCDFDGDGDLDMLLDNSGNRITGQGNFTQVLRNDGKGLFTDETLTVIVGEPGGDDNAVKCVDVNGDGRYDLLVASLTVPSEKLLINDGLGHFVFVPNALPVTSDPTLGIDVGDLDGDGIYDVVTGQGEGNKRVDRLFKGMGESKRDVTPPKFRAVERPTPVVGAPILVRMAPTDGYTSETGEHVVDVYLTYQVNGGTAQRIDATFIGGDLFRAAIPGQPNGTTLTIKPYAVDRVGLVSDAPSFALIVGTIVVPEPDAGVEVPDAAVDAAIELPDATVDATVEEPDAGMEEPDAGIEAPDAAIDEPEVDAGIEAEPEEPSEPEEPEADAGVIATPEDGGRKSNDGCSVGAVGAEDGSGGLFSVLGLALLAFRRTRTQRRRG